MSRSSITTLIFSLITTILFSQNKTDTIPRKYSPLKYYKLNNKKPLTKKDSLNFIYINNDTLVLLENYTEPKGVRVPYEPKDSTFLEYYKKVAFNHRNDSLNKKTPMKYWKENIKIFFTESVSKNTKKDFMTFAKTISNQIDSLHVSETKRVEDSNYIVYYFGDYEYEPKMSSFKYSDGYSWWKHNKIYRYSIKLDTKLYFSERLIQNKLREYFITSLGYFKQTDDFDCESYFSNCYSPNKKLTQLDMELLKYHYSYGICKGTSLEVFEDQHRRAKKIYEETGYHMYFLHID